MKACKGKGLNWRHVWRYLDTADGKSTSNLCHHAKICWGKDTVVGVDAGRSHDAAHEVIEKSLRMQDRSITAMFECVKGDGKVTYLHKQHTKTKAWYALICLPAHMLITLSVWRLSNGWLKVCVPLR